MFKKKKKVEEKQEMCPETASLYTKLHNEPYLKTHRGAFALYQVWSFLKNVFGFAVLILLTGLAFTDVSIYLKTFFWG